MLSLVYTTVNGLVLQFHTTYLSKTLPFLTLSL